MWACAEQRRGRGGGGGALADTPHWYRKAGARAQCGVATCGEMTCHVPRASCLRFLIQVRCAGDQGDGLPARGARAAARARQPAAAAAARRRRLCLPNVARRGAAAAAAAAARWRGRGGCRDAGVHPGGVQGVQAAAVRDANRHRARGQLWTPENDCTTAATKLKRQVITKKHATRARGLPACAARGAPSWQTPRCGRCSI